MLSLEGGPGYYASRSLKEVWNIGHLLFFCLVSIYCLRYIVSFTNLRIILQVIYLIIITAVISIIIEWSQKIFSSGVPDITDIRRNFIGMIFGYVLAISIKKTYILNLLRGLVILLVLIEITPLFQVLMDEYRASRTFPILSDFESNFELSRWYSDEQFFISHKNKVHGNSSLRVSFGTDNYSSVSLRYFPSDWSKYKYLKFHLFYTGVDTLNVSCLIHDEPDKKNINVYEDQFIQRNYLINGWNEISILLENVRNYPRFRKMKMNKIKGVDIYTSRLQQVKNLYLDYVRLE